MRLSIDTDKCVASGSCVFAAPEIFDQDGDGIVVLLMEEPPPELHEKAKAAELVCPAAVIWSD